MRTRSANADEPAVAGESEARFSRRKLRGTPELPPPGIGKACIACAAKTSEQPAAEQREDVVGAIFVEVVRPRF